MPYISSSSIWRLTSKSSKPVSFITPVYHFTLYIEGSSIIILIFFFFMRFDLIGDQIPLWIKLAVVSLITMYSIHLLLHSLKELLLLIRFDNKEIVLLLVPNFSAFIRLFEILDGLIKLCQYFLFSFPHTFEFNFRFVNMSIQMTLDISKSTWGEVYITCDTVPGTCLILIDLIMEPIDDSIAFLSLAINLLCHF